MKYIGLLKENNTFTTKTFKNHSKINTCTTQTFKNISKTYTFTIQAFEILNKTYTFTIHTLKYLRNTYTFLVCGWTRPETGNQFLFVDGKLIIFLLNSFIKDARNMIWWTQADLEIFGTLLRILVKVIYCNVKLRRCMETIGCLYHNSYLPEVSSDSQRVCARFCIHPDLLRARQNFTSLLTLKTSP